LEDNKNGENDVDLEGSFLHKKIYLMKHIRKLVEDWIGIILRIGGENRSQLYHLDVIMY